MTEIIRSITSDTQRLAVFCVIVIPLTVSAVLGLAKMFFAHQERMNLILQGIHPDLPPDELISDAEDESTAETSIHT